MTLINSEYGKRGGSEMLQVIKRDGTKVPFDKHKIAVAIERQNIVVRGYMNLA